MIGKLVGGFKMYAILGLGAVVAGGGLYLKGRYDGFASCEAKAETAVQKKTIAEARGVGRLETAKVRHDAKVKKSIRTVRQAIDPANCTSTRAPVDTLRQHGWVRDDAVRR